MNNNEIIYNPYCLNDCDIDETKEKVRLLISNSNKEILIGNYNGTYLLPGGKIETGETSFEALKREIKEEVGIDLNEGINSLVKIIYYQKNYPKMDNTMPNRKVTTHYFTTEMDIDLNNIITTLSEREKNGNFVLEWINQNKIRNLISNNNSSNPRKIYFDKELLQVLEIYKSRLGNKSEMQYMIEDSKKLYKPTYGIYSDIEEKEYQYISNTLNKIYFNGIINPYKKSKKIIDMHTHTNYSDGEKSPDELIMLAVKKGIDTLSITDHDTLEGIKQIDMKDPLICDSGIKIISGIELSAKSDTGRMHILGYGMDINNYDLNSKLIEIRNNSIYHIISLLHQLKKDYNIIFSTKDIQNLINSNHNLNRVDLAKLCIKYKLASDVQDAFNKYLIAANEKIRKDDKTSLSYIECFDLIIKSGGIPVLAHPNSLELNNVELLKLIKEMVKYGLQGIECYHSSFSKEESNFYLDIANEFGLLVSGGSDFHGKGVKPGIELGTGKNNNLNIKKLTLLDKLKR